MRPCIWKVYFKVTSKFNESWYYDTHKQNNEHRHQFTQISMYEIDFGETYYQVKMWRMHVIEAYSIYKVHFLLVVSHLYHPVKSLPNNAKAC